MTIEVFDTREIRWQANDGSYQMAWDRAAELVNIVTPHGTLCLGHQAAMEVLKGLDTLLNLTTVKTERHKDLPPNAGLAWTKELDTELSRLWYAGETVSVIATRMGRTHSSIEARLVRIGLVDARDEARARTEVDDGL